MNVFCAVLQEKFPNEINTISFDGDNVFDIDLYPMVERQPFLKNFDEFMVEYVSVHGAEEIYDVYLNRGKEVIEFQYGNEIVRRIGEIEVNGQPQKVFFLRTGDPDTYIAYDVDFSIVAELSRGYDGNEWMVRPNELESQKRALTDMLFGKSE
jgi:hypothetical protein